MSTTTTSERGRPSWNVTTSLPGLSAFVAGEELADLVDAGADIAVLTADLATSNRLTDFAERHPERFLNMGIAEQNMVSVAAGLASTGTQTFVATFASFVSLLCAEQIRTDLAYTQMPVRILAHHAGISMGFYGTSHHATEDIAITRSIAGLTVLAPCDGPSTRAAIRASLDEPGPVYIRLGRGSEREVYPDVPVLDRGRFVEVRSGGDLTVIATGIGVRIAAEAADTLAAEGIGVTVLDAIYLKPLDTDRVVAEATATGRILTIEEHNVIGGLGTAVAEAVALAGITARLERLALADEYALIAPPTHLYRHYGFTAAGVVDKIRSLLG
ncbi:transketolase C-terminal domain-containing protein [Mycobacterium sp. M26]|uniref:transketolase family protein n=1 Tax=Mycobacterium sp. M26 TaxID=1762962 RepID=UPI00073F2C30|nr:transketolase C-terminal domain-containing protein [Mycobacterium sp. M26]